MGLRDVREHNLIHVSPSQSPETPGWTGTGNQAALPGEITLRKAKPEFSHHPPLWGVEGKSKTKVTKFKPKMPKITRDFLPLGKNESSKGD